MGNTATTATSFDYTQGVDYPVRIELPMPRILFDRLTDHHHRAPLGRYDEATGRAEFLAMPKSHEARTALVTRLFHHVETRLADRGPWPGFLHSGSLRLLSDEGAFEPDASLYLNPFRAKAVKEIEGYLDARRGYPVPDLVVEVDRSVQSRSKLAPYLRMGVREVWIWSRAHGASIWLPDTTADDGMALGEDSVVMPGITGDDLNRLLADGSQEERFRLSRAMALRVAEAWAS